MTKACLPAGRKGLSGGILKIIAILSMLIDHIGAVLMENTAPYLTLRLIGRAAFPIFAFLLAEGFSHTKNKKKYGLRLALFALLSELPFDLAFNRTLFDPQSQNVFFTLLIGFLSMSAIEYIKKNPALQDSPPAAGRVSGNSPSAAVRSRPEGFCFIGNCEAISCEIKQSAPAKGFSPLFSRALIALATALGMLAAWILKTDYHAIGVLAILFFYWLPSHRILASFDACIWLILAFPLEITSIASIPLIAFYNGRRGISLKYVFYFFYPVHLLILYYISLSFPLR